LPFYSFAKKLWQNERVKMQLQISPFKTRAWIAVGEEGIGDQVSLERNGRF
jgi:hypothetical protein